jgi:hypothetical protein
MFKKWHQIQSRFFWRLSSFGLNSFGVRNLSSLKMTQFRGKLIYGAIRAGRHMQDLAI